MVPSGDLGLGGPDLEDQQLPLHRRRVLAVGYPVVAHEAGGGNGDLLAVAPGGRAVGAGVVGVRLADGRAAPAPVEEQQDALWPAEGLGGGAVDEKQAVVGLTVTDGPPAGTVALPIRPLESKSSKVKFASPYCA